jgi:hypothetical protein
MVGLGLAASGHWPYAVKYTGAMVLGNLCFAILMRNEVFGRMLYLIVNTCFAKVCAADSHLCYRDSQLRSGRRYGGDSVALLFFRYEHSLNFGQRGV